MQVCSQLQYVCVMWKVARWLANDETHNKTLSTLYECVLAAREYEF